MSHSQLPSPSPTPEGGLPGCERAMSGSKSRSSKSAAVSALAGDHHDLRVAVERPGVEVHRAEADDVVGDDHLGVDDRPGELPDLHPGADQIVIAMLEGRARLRVVRRLRDDDAHADAAPGGRQDPLEHVAVREVGVHHIEPPARAVDLLADRLRGGDEPAGDDLRKRDRNRPGCGRRGEVGVEVVGQGAAEAAEAREEGRLSLADDVARDANHHVVEAAVLEVVLDSRAPGPRDLAVDHVELPVVGTADLVLAPVEVAMVRVETVAVEGKHIVDDDLRTGFGKPAEHLLRGAVRPGAEGVDDHPHLDTLRELPLEQVGHLRPDLALAPAEHEDVDGRPRRLHVGEDPREERLALDPGLDRRGGRPGEVEIRVVRSRPLAGGERCGCRLRARRRDRVRRRRPTRPLCDPEHLPEDKDEEKREHEEGDGHGCPSPTAGHVRARAGGVAEKRNRADGGERCQHRARREDEEQAVGDIGAQDALRVTPVLRGRPADHERTREHADDANPGAALHRPHPQEGRDRQEDAEPAVVRPLDPVEGHVVLGEPCAEHPDHDGHDRDPHGHGVQERPVRSEEAAHRQPAFRPTRRTRPPALVSQAWSSTPQSTPRATDAIDATIARMSSVDADSGIASTVVRPIRPSEPGTRSQNPGRKTAYTGIADGRRARR